METLKVISIGFGFIGAMTMYPIYPLLSLLVAMIAISYFFREEENPEKHQLKAI